MKKKEVIEIANKNNGYLYSSIIKEHSIPTSTVSRLVKDGILEKVYPGVYLTSVGVYDDLFVYSLKYSKIIYSGETALFLNDLSNKQSPTYEFTIPYGTFTPNIDNFNVKYSRKDTVDLGVIEIETQFGNKVKSYDKERCICDLFIRPDYYDYEDRVYAINEYKNNYLDFKKLYNYAEKLGVLKEVKNVFEVIGWN